METIYLEETDSTNNWIAGHENKLPSQAMVWCRRQYAGRGQRGNSWESEPGKNFTGSLLLHPENFPATKQFHLSEAVAMAIIDTLDAYGIQATVKWPNDIYVGDQKICGILFEHVVTGKNITRSIVGIGLNVNQERFISDAPNPVSMKMITGNEFDLKEVAERLAFYLASHTNRLFDETESFHSRYMSLLWRNDGNYYPFRDKKTGIAIRGKIIEVAPDGIISIVTEKGDVNRYAFKEIEFLIDESIL
ncbi:MAG: biotin--[acetyl-CoA-carboxylase] ligase [Muribaculaceae bacterium]|nr:biotin--[acetyl-CoA-carboxylase] ligase [Muribaculaceae bacterium]